MPPPRSPPPPRGPPPPGPRPNVPPPGPPGPPAAASFFAPNPNVLLRRTFKVKRPGPVASLIGMTGDPGTVTRLKQPYGVCVTPLAPAEQLPMVARVLKTASPYKSCPVVILKGAPDQATIKGLKRKSYGKPIEPPTKTRWRTSKEARP